jgi:hypothetical protein
MEVGAAPAAAEDDNNVAAAAVEEFSRRFSQPQKSKLAHPRKIVIMDVSIFFSGGLLLEIVSQLGMVSLKKLPFFNHLPQQQKGYLACWMLISAQSVKAASRILRKDLLCYVTTRSREKLVINYYLLL